MATAVAQAAMIAACSPARLHDALPPGRLILQLPGIQLSSAIFQHRVARVLVPARLACQAGSDPVGLAPSASKELEVEDLQTSIPNPIVNIDQYSDPFATVVEMSYGTRLGALLDTIQALTDLGLNVVRGYVSLKAADVRTNRFYITRARGSQALAVNWDDGAKVEDPQLLESIRLTIINNLLQYHPESSERLAMGEAFGATAPPQKLDVDIATHINVTKLGPDRSLLKIETADRPGLLIEILKVLSDISVVVESAELDTEGLVAKDQLYVSYHGEALSPSMEEVIKNCLQYYLRRPTTEEDSY